MTGEGGYVHANRPTAMLLPAPSFAKPDIVRRFLAFAQCAGPEKRANAASALARAYLHSDLAQAMRTEAELAMTALLDDPSPLVRRAIAEALGSAGDAPRPLILALASDQLEVAAAVLSRSPALTDADLVDCVAIGDVVAQTAIARRADLLPGAIAALAEIGQREAILALIGNREVALVAAALARIFARFGADAEVREALLERPSLGASLRAQIVVATANELSVAASQWLASERAERIAREARDQAICSIASACPDGERAELVRSLRASGALTPALLLRSLLGGERDLFAGAVAELSGAPLRRVAAFIRDPRGEGFAALAHKAGLKSGVLPAFRAALAAMKVHVAEVGDGLRLPLVQAVIDECERRDDPALAKVLALLWRFAAEAVRAEARDAIASAPLGRLPRNLDFSANDDASAKPTPSPDFDTLRLGPAHRTQRRGRRADRRPGAAYRTAAGAHRRARRRGVKSRRQPPPPRFAWSPSPISWGRKRPAAAFSSLAKRGRGTARMRGGGGEAAQLLDRRFADGLVHRLARLRHRA